MEIFLTVESKQVNRGRLLSRAPSLQSLSGKIKLTLEYLIIKHVCLLFSQKNVDCAGLFESGHLLNLDFPKKIVMKKGRKMETNEIKTFFSPLFFMETSALCYYSKLFAY